MPNTQLPPAKEKAAEISRKIANTRPVTRDKDSPEGQVSGGFNQKRDQDVTDKAQKTVEQKRPDDEENSATDGDGQ